MDIKMCTRIINGSSSHSEDMDRWVGKAAIVTGSSAGIGEKIAEALVKEGLLVVGLARRLENLEALEKRLEGAKGKFYPKQCDVTDTEKFQCVFKWVDTEFGGVHVLVNNAGLWTPKRFIDDDIEGFRKTLELNVMAPAVGVREAVASMRRRNVVGHIININSVAGHWIPFENPCSLCPSAKHAITAMTETVRRDLVAVGSKIKITSISPGVVKTDIARAAGVPDPEGLFSKFPCLKPENIAAAVIYVLGNPEHVQVTELTIRPVGEAL
ncbi:farnesol dehydrogenase-like [Neodiprion virginianus]|uniref:Farnesol dehydrogenase n=1 Tax=Neodiprion lecontei TaxID=441921 RepID=A0A6J0BF13_NEOLC|nr:farnesol dehydrogenase [Neodiprion lecontei]XP_046621203.1 farnesol dehydrogenase-like [Neodiprion virginianus]